MLINKQTTQILFLLTFLFSGSCFGFTDFSKIEFKFLTASESSLFLSTEDDFIRSLTPLDLSLHHATSRNVSKQEQLEFLKSVALDWTPEEVARLKDKIEIMKTAINSLDLKLTLPAEILLIKTSGADEFTAHYTRGNAIIFPIKSVLEGVTTDLPTIFHELFHVMSRHNPELSDDLYAICNYKPIERIAIPKSLEDVAITNPDAFFYEHSVSLNANGAQIEVIPFFYSSIKQAEIKGPADPAMTFRLGLLDLATINDEHPKLYKAAETDYKVRVSANSHYYIHPEEIMAENFRLLLSLAAGVNPPPAIKYQEPINALSDLLKK